MCVSADLFDILVVVLMVPLLALALWFLTGFLRGDTDPGFLFGCALIVEPRRRR